MAAAITTIGRRGYAGDQPGGSLGGGPNLGKIAPQRPLSQIHRPPHLTFLTLGLQPSGQAAPVQLGALATGPHVADAQHELGTQSASTAHSAGWGVGSAFQSSWGVAVRVGVGVGVGSSIEEGTQAIEVQMNRQRTQRIVINLIPFGYRPRSVRRHRCAHRPRKNMRSRHAACLYRSPRHRRSLYTRRSPVARLCY